MKIKILLDHVSREIDFAVNLKKTIEENKLGNVEIFHQDYIAKPGDYDFFRATFDGSYDVIIVPSYHVRRTPALLLRAVVSRAKLVVYHSEQIIREYIEVDKLNLNYLKQFDRHVAAHFVWGEHYAEKLIRKAGISAKKIFIVGNYKMDFVESTPGKVNKRILVASDYKPADMTDDGALNFEREYGVKYDLLRRDNCKKARRYMLDFVEEQARLFPDVTFLLRPHPGESLDEYNGKITNNIELSSPGSTYSSDLNVSDFVIGFTSTSCMEVISTKKRFYSIDFFDFDKSDLSPHKELLEWKNISEIHEIIANLSNNIIPIRNHDIEKRLCKLISQEENVGNNIIIALREIASKNYKYNTTLTYNDVFPLAFLVVASALKTSVIKLSSLFNSAFFTKVINKKVKDSYEKRCQNSEVVSNEVVASFMISQKGYKYDESVTLVSSSFGFSFKKAI